MRFNALKFNKITIAIMSGLIGSVPQAFAQSTGSSESGDESSKLQTVTVSAERPTGFAVKTVQVGAFRDQQMLDVPLTVNVIPSAMLEAQDSRGVFDAMRNTAGVTRAQLSGAIYDNLAIRGISLQNRTNYRLNGSLPIINLIDMPLENKERVEALKGASSLYYGFTTPVGVINLVTKRAGPQPVASVSLSGSEYGQFVQHGDYGQTFGSEQEFGARINVVNGSLKNAAPGTSGDRSLFTAALDWRASSQLSFAFDYEDIKKRITEPAAIVIPTAVNGAIALPQIPDPRNLIGGNWPQNDAKANNMLLRIDYSINDSWYALGEVGRAQTRRDKRDYSEIGKFDNVTGSGTLAFSLTRDLDFVNKNTRLEIGGRVKGAGLIHDITFGVMQNSLYQAGANSQAVSVPQNLYNPSPIAFIDKTAPTILNPINTTDKGVYAMDRITFGDFQFTAAVRSEDYQTTTVKNTSSPPVTTVYSATPTTYSYAALYKVRKDTSIYASYIEGLEEGPIAPITAANAGAILPPAISTQKEIGIRSEFLKGSSASIAYFEIERATSYTNSNNYVVLDGRTLIKGYEGSFAGSLTSELSLYGSLMILDAKLAQAQTIALTGKTPDNTPSMTSSIFLDYKPTSLTGFSINVGAYYTGQRFINPLNQAEIPGYTTYTAGLSYKSKINGHPFLIQSNVSNLSNLRYWETGGAGYLAVGAPRTITFNTKYEF